MKKTVMIIGIILLVLILGVGIFHNINNIKFEGPINLECDKEATIDEKVSKTIIANCSNKYEGGHQAGEGHIILGTEEKKEETLVYALATYGKYTIGNGSYTRVAGTDITPIVIKLLEDEKGSVISNIIWISKDEKMIKRLYPEEYRERVLYISEGDRIILEEMEYEYVKDNIMKEFFSKPSSEQRDIIKDLLGNKSTIQNSMNDFSVDEFLSNI